MKVLVCGGRDYDDRDCVVSTLDLLDDIYGPIACIIHGCAAGADTLGKAWAQLHDRKHEPFRADWNTHGRGAGMIRNARMLADGKPDLVVAFPGGRGTADMVRRAKAASVEVIEIPGKEPAP